MCPLVKSSVSAMVAGNWLPEIVWAIGVFGSVMLLRFITVVRKISVRE
jgi:lipid-A-disaccharide synthase-like uncharacterized protein